MVRSGALRGPFFVAICAFDLPRAQSLNRVVSVDPNSLNLERYDAVVVGSGFAGVAVAKQLTSLGRKAIVIETGGRDYDQTGAVDVSLHFVASKPSEDDPIERGLRARMGDDPRSSVVDRDCRVHGYRNLFVAGSSVFASGGYANPTLTLSALATRLGDRIAEGI